VLSAEEPPTIELWEAQKRADLFRQASGRELVLESELRRRDRVADAARR